MSDYEESEYEMSEVESEQEEESSSDDKFLTTSELEEEMKETISEVQAILQVPPGVSRILLHKYKFNKHVLLEKFYECLDTNAFLIAAQVTPESPTTSESSTGECQICCDDSGELSGLACGHMACGECWKGYFTEKITAGGVGEIQCMESGCKLLVEDEKVLTYITDPTLIAAYRRLALESYVEINRELKWCPGTECGRAVKISHYEDHPISCPCGSTFCFTCGSDWHAPINCHLFKLWERRCLDDSETYNWIHANTKDCPRCHGAIEKNGGCNRILCRRCKFEFCWMCMRSWDVHGYSPCNSFEDKKAIDSRQKSRYSLDRYLFYYNRFVGHQKSLKLEEKLKTKIAKKMETLQNMSQMSWVEVQFLPQAVDILSVCRRTMMFTYAFAFYLKKDNNSLIFETNQKDLEMATEQLSGFLEQDSTFDTDDMKSLKMQVLDKCRYVEHRRQLLLDHCAEGTEQDFWKFDERNN